MAIHEGAPAPAIELQTDAGETFRLSDLKGKNVVVYFYPKADTPGCTTEACDFRDHMTKFEKADTVIVGISPDATKAQAKFKTKYGLPFTLLADVDHAVADAFGVWVEKSMYGKKYMGVERSTFLIDKGGKVVKAFNKVKVAGHAEQVLEALQSL
ncbi:MAG: thioredoxin-dependent thiol peroxidase [Bryobacteraceae bacterium]